MLTNIEVLNSQLTSNNEKIFKTYLFRNLLTVNRLYPVYNDFTIREKIIYNNLLIAKVRNQNKLRTKNGKYVDSTQNFLHSFSVKDKTFIEFIPITICSCGIKKCKNKQHKRIAVVDEKTGNVKMFPKIIYWNDLPYEYFTKLHHLAN
jgi:hypothetical protein